MTIRCFTGWLGDTYLLLVHHLELEAKDCEAILVLQRLLHRVVVDVPVDQVELQGVAGGTMCVFKYVLHVAETVLSSHGSYFGDMDSGRMSSIGVSK